MRQNSRAEMSRRGVGFDVHEVDVDEGCDSYR